MADVSCRDVALIAGCCRLIFGSKLVVGRIYSEEHGATERRNGGAGLLPVAGMVLAAGSRLSMIKFVGEVAVSYQGSSNWAPSTVDAERGRLSFF